MTLWVSMGETCFRRLDGPGEDIGLAINALLV